MSFHDSYICVECGQLSVNGVTHPRCKSAYGIDGVSSAVVYNGIVKKIVYQFKYEPYLTQLSESMTPLLYENLVQQESLYFFVQHSPILVPVPLHPKRFRKRGYNQAQLLGCGLGEICNLTLLPHLLVRTRETKPQFNLAKAERRENMKGAFELSQHYESFVRGKRFLLIDDVTTTGSTLKECAKVLKQHGATQVWGYTFAREEIK